MKLIAIFAFFLLAFQPFFAIEHHDSMIYEGNCKEVMVVGNATAGNYTLLLKVRDPARQGYQVLCSIPAGYEYDYHNPWLGYKMHFVVRHKFIGTTTYSDTPPNIVKPGMMINDAGIAFADADVLSYTTNPSPYAWDDFDWMRYAAQSAASLEEAVQLLSEVVKKMHATKIAENIFVAGEEKGAIIEGDAIHFTVKYIDDGIAVQSNYPKELWRKHIIYPLFISSNFSSNFTGWVRKNSIIRMGGLFGIKVSEIGENYIVARMYPFGVKEKIIIGKGKPIGYFWLNVSKISGNRAKVFACYKYFMWEKEVKKKLQKNYGKIDVADLMRLSRLHGKDIDGLRAMCQGGYEAATIYKIPEGMPALSCLWFATDQCSSIFVPLHICDIDIFDPYENGDAAKLSLKLLQNYGHGNITKWCEEIERDFINETNRNEKIAKSMIENGHYRDASIFLTKSDMQMQMEAFLIEKLWLNMSFLTTQFEKVSRALQPFWKKFDENELNRAIRCIASIDCKPSEKKYMENIIKNLVSLKHAMEG